MILYKVFVKDMNDFFDILCDCVGNGMYRCGLCKSVIRVRSEDDHDLKCMGCSRDVTVRKFTDDPYRS